MPSVLALGLDPVFADYTQMPGLTPSLVQSFIDAQLARVRDAGYGVESCLVDLGDTALAKVENHLKERTFDCVVIGAGLREPSRLVLLEKLIDVIRALAPAAKICFNTTPADTLEAVRRWV